MNNRRICINPGVLFRFLYENVEPAGKVPGNYNPGKTFRCVGAQGIIHKYGLFALLGKI